MAPCRTIQEDAMCTSANKFKRTIRHAPHSKGRQRERKSIQPKIGRVAVPIYFRPDKEKGIKYSRALLY